MGKLKEDKAQADLEKLKASFWERLRANPLGVWGRDRRSRSRAANPRPRVELEATQVPEDPSSSQD